MYIVVLSSCALDVFIMLTSLNVFYMFNDGVNDGMVPYDHSKHKEAYVNVTF